MDMTMVLLNESGRWLVGQLGRMSVELAILAGIVLIALYVLRVKSPALRHLFWGLLLAKPVVTFLVASPLSLYAVLWPPAPTVIYTPPQMVVHIERAPLPLPAAPLPQAAPSAPAPLPEAPPFWRQIDRYGLASAVWMLAASLLGLRLLLGCTYVTFLRTTARTRREGPLAELVAEAAATLRVRRRVSIATTTVCHGPVLAGIFRPVILLPENMTDALTRAQLKLVVTHELAHARRWDNLVLLIQRLAEILFFFHPVVWLCGWMMRREAEAACDDMVVSAYGDLDGASAAAYADSLTRVAEMKCGITRRLLVNTFAAAESNFHRRIRRILSGRRTRMTLWLSLATGAALILIGVLGLPAASAPKDMDKPDSAKIHTAAEKSASKTAEEPYYLTLSENGGALLSVPVEESTAKDSKGKTGTYDARTILSDFKAREKVYAELRAEVDKLQKELDQKSKAAQQEKEKFEKEKDGLSTQDEAARKERIDALYKEYQDGLKANQQEIDEKEKAAFEPFAKELKEAARQAGDELGCGDAKPQAEISSNDGTATIDLTRRIRQLLGDKLLNRPRLLRIQSGADGPLAEIETVKTGATHWYKAGEAFEEFRLIKIDKEKEAAFVGVEDGGKEIPIRLELQPRTAQESAPVSDESALKAKEEVEGKWDGINSYTAMIESTNDDKENVRRGYTMHSRVWALKNADGVLMYRIETDKITFGNPDRKGFDKFVMVYDGKDVYRETQAAGGIEVRVRRDAADVDFGNGAIGLRKNFEQCFQNEAFTLLPEEEVGGKGVYVFEGRSKRSQKVTPYRLYIDKETGFELKYERGHNRSMLSDVKLNAPVDPSLFKYTPPENAKVIDSSASADAQDAPQGGFTHLVTFEPAGDFHPERPRELLDVFNGVCRTRTGYFRTKPQDGKLVGRICTDAPEEIQKSLEKELRLKWVEAVPLTGELFAQHSASKQESLSGNPATTSGAYATPEGGYTHLVAFETTEGFHLTSKQLLEVFNGVCKAKTGYFRTTRQDGRLVGRICTDAPDEVKKAIEKEPRLKWVETVPLTADLFAQHAAVKQEKSNLEEALDLPVSIEFENTHLSKIVNFITDSYEINIDIDWRAVAPPPSRHPAKIELDRVSDGKVPYISLRNVALRDALSALLRPLNLSVKVESSMVWISSSALMEADGKRPQPDVRSASENLSKALASPVSMEFEDIHLSEVAEFISDSWDVNIVLDNRVIPPRPKNPNEPAPTSPAFVTDANVVRVNLRNTPLAEALQALLRPLNLTFKADKDIVWISSDAMMGAAPTASAGSGATENSPVAQQEPVLPTVSAGPPAFAVELQGGRRMELVSIHEHRSENKAFWRPDGAPLSEAPYNPDELKESVAAQGKGYEFAFRTTGLPAGEPIEYHFEGSTGWAMAGSSDHPDLTVATVFLDAKATTENITVFVASGDWTTMMTEEPQGGAANGAQGYSVIFGETYEKEDTTCITVTLEGSITERALRLCALDMTGNLHTSTANKTSAGKARQSTHRFSGVKPQDIKEFQLQTRPWQDVQFTNISLDAGRHTDCKVTVAAVADETPKVPKTITSTIQGRPEFPESLSAALTKGRITATISGTKQLIEALWMASNVSFVVQDMPAFEPVSATDASPLKIMEEVVAKSGGNACFIARPYGILVTSAEKASAIPGASIPANVPCTAVQQTDGSVPRPALPESVGKALTRQPLTLSSDGPEPGLSSLVEKLSISSELSFAVQLDIMLKPCFFNETTAKDIMLAISDMTQGQVCFVLRDYGFLVASRDAAQWLSGASVPEELSLEPAKAVNARPSLSEPVKQRLTKETVTVNVRPANFYSVGNESLASVLNLGAGVALSTDGDALKELFPAQAAAPLCLMRDSNCLLLMEALVEASNGNLCFVFPSAFVNLASPGASAVTLTTFSKAKTISGPAIGQVPVIQADAMPAGTVANGDNVPQYTAEMKLIAGSRASVESFCAGLKVGREIEHGPEAERAFSTSDEKGIEVVFAASDKDSDLELLSAPRVTFKAAEEASKVQDAPAAGPLKVVLRAETIKPLGQGNEITKAAMETFFGDYSVSLLDFFRNEMPTAVIADARENALDKRTKDEEPKEIPEGIAMALRLDKTDQPDAFGLKFYFNVKEVVKRSRGLAFWKPKPAPDIFESPVVLRMTPPNPYRLGEWVVVVTKNRDPKKATLAMLHIEPVPPGVRFAESKT